MKLHRYVSTLLWSFLGHGSCIYFLAQSVTCKDSSDTIVTTVVDIYRNRMLESTIFVVAFVHSETVHEAILPSTFIYLHLKATALGTTLLSLFEGYMLGGRQGGACWSYLKAQKMLCDRDRNICFFQK